MLTAGDLREQYKKLSDGALLEILASKQDYEPMAVEIAEQELETRHLSNDELENAKSLLAEKEREKEVQLQKIKAVETTLKNAGSVFIQTINPIQHQLPAAARIIKSISLAYGAIFLFTIIDDFKLVWHSIRDIPGFPAISLGFLIPLFLIPLAVFLFFKRRTSGWILLCIFVSFSLVGISWSLLHALTRYSGRTRLTDAIIHSPGPFINLVQLSFLVGTLYLLCKKDIKETYVINNQKAISSIVLSVLAGLLFMQEG